MDTMLQSRLAEVQGIEPISNAPEPRQEIEPETNEPDDALHWAQDGYRPSDHVGSIVPLLIPHHAKVLVKGKLAHGVKGIEVH